jgi:hypothetical protein
MSKRPISSVESETATQEKRRKQSAGFTPGGEPPTPVAMCAFESPAASGESSAQVEETLAVPDFLLDVQPHINGSVLTVQPLRYLVDIGPDGTERVGIIVGAFMVSSYELNNYVLGYCGFEITPERITLSSEFCNRPAVKWVNTLDAEAAASRVCLPYCSHDLATYFNIAICRSVRESYQEEACASSRQDIRGSCEGSSDQASL